MSKIVKQIRCCKVCVDAGKVESVYSSHWVKDNNGVVICPTLLSQECRYCHLPGHTITHCSLYSKKNEVNSSVKKLTVQLKTKKTEKKEPKKAKPETAGRYAAFIDYGDDSDGEDAHKKKKVKTETEAEAETTETETVIKKMSFADIVARTIVEPKIVVHIAPTEDVMAKLNNSTKSLNEIYETEQRRQLREVRNKQAFRGLNGLSWGDMEDDTDDECDNQSDDQSDNLSVNQKEDDRYDNEEYVKPRQLPPWGNYKRVSFQRL